MDRTVRQPEPPIARPTVIALGARGGNKRDVRHSAAALCAGLLGLMGFHSAVFSSGFERVPGDRGDARTAVYFVEHWFQFFQGNAELLSPGMFYPVEGALGYTDTMLLHALPYSALRLAGLDMFSSLIVPVLLFSLLNYATCFLLLHRTLRLSAVASVAGGLFFAFNSPRLNHPGHFNFQASFFLPLALIFIIRFFRESHSLNQQQAFRLLATASLCVFLQSFISLHQVWFLAFWSFLFCLAALLLRPTRDLIARLVGEFWPALTGAAGILFLGLLPLFAIYVPAARSVGPRPYHFVERLIPEGWSLLQMGGNNYVWGGVSRALTGFHPLLSTEHNVGIGLIPSLLWLGLTAWSIQAVARQLGAARSDTTRLEVHTLFFALMILATTAFYVIGMRYVDGSSPWRLVYLYFPGANSLRSVARYVMFLSLPMAIAFAVVVHRFIGHVSTSNTPWPRRLSVTAVLAATAFGLFEQFGRTTSFSRTRELIRLNKLAAALPQGCVSFYVAAAPGRSPQKHEDQIDAMLVSTIRNVPTLNGYSGHVPPGWSLREVEAPDYEQRVARWIARYNLSPPVCRLEIGD